ncbi:MAG: zinc ribbon domain-containing protein [Pseudorhodobacter sp.]
MASCSNCGKDVSPRAKFCPKCGEPDPVVRWWQVVIALVVLWVFVKWVFFN